MTTRRTDGRTGGRSQSRGRKTMMMLQNAMMGNDDNDGMGLEEKKGKSQWMGSANVETRHVEERLITIRGAHD